jgi:hypothetical protein
MKTYKCLSCDTTFTLGRGRPPLRPLCPVHKPAGASVAPAKAPRNIDKTPSTNITVRNISEAPMSLEIHGGRPGRAITSPCPNCNYAYADGGYCPMGDGENGCGWTLPIERLPFGTSTGERWKK